jgi:hypothetical protein
MLNFHAKMLGYAGLIPFIALPFYVLWGNVSYFEGISFFIQYSAIILSFLGGVLWINAIRHSHSQSQLYLSMLPSLLGWLCITIIPPLPALIMLGLTFLCVLWIEFKSIDQAAWYRSLRIRLTAIAVGGHVMMIWLVWRGW